MARLYKRSRKKVDDSAPDQLSFLLNDELIRVENVKPTLTILDFLRQQKGLHGTKQGCTDGGCGACTVTIGEMQGSSMNYQAINSCISFVSSLHNKHLITVEGIKTKGKLHPVQQCLVSAHATQCGFCSPGFVMSLYTLCYESKASFTRENINDVLSGNLCRCTGYRPIIAAAQKLLKRKNLASSCYSPQHVLGKLKKTPYKTAQTFAHEKCTYYSPVNADEVAQIILDHPDATIVAGGTDVVVNTNNQHTQLKQVISLDRVRALKMIRKGKDMFAFGAGVTLNEMRTAVAGDYPDLDELIRRFGSRQIRNRATVIGNIAAASPTADMPPALIVLDAKITLRAGNYRRFIKLENYFIGDGVQDLKRGEFIESLQIPRAARSSIFHVYKLSKRGDQDISSLSGAFFLRTDKEEIVRDIRICFSGMAAIPKRAGNVEQALLEEKWSLQTINKVISLFNADYQPGSDFRGCAEYRMIAAKNLLKRFYLETRSDSIQTRLTGETFD